MKNLLWLSIIVLGVTACGGTTADTPSTTLPEAPSTTASTAVQVTGVDLSGISFDVHQEPG